MSEEEGIYWYEAIKRLENKMEKAISEFDAKRDSISLSDTLLFIAEITGNQNERLHILGKAIYTMQQNQK